MPRRCIAEMLCLAIAAFAVGCRPSASSTAKPAAGTTRLQGAGASFPAPFYKRLVVEYQGIHPDVLIDYQSIGSGGGIQAITDKTVHFCGSDAPMNKKELEARRRRSEHRRVSVVCGRRGRRRTTCRV